jgi:thiol-disulfide isomerase/thioredoxin
MQFFISFVFLISAFTVALGQNEQSPMVEKDFGYKDWTFKNLNGGGETNLRSFVKGKKLVMVVYWAPWCHNWAHDAAFVEELNAKYAKNGLAVIGVGEYDTLDKMKENYEQNKLTFPSVYESAASSERLSTTHYVQRTAAGDTRKWGSPWYVFLEPSKMEASGEVLESKPFVVNGELIRPDAEKFIRASLGLPASGGSAVASAKNAIEVCPPEAKQPPLRKP